MNRFSLVTRLAPMVLLAACGGAAHAGMITADYTYLNSITGVNFTAALPGLSGASSQGTTLFGGLRTDLPAGPGVDNNVPLNFRAFCVEIGENLAQGSQSHSSVTPLLGSSTNSGGVSGPVLFDAVRTANLQTLWGSYFSSVVDANSAAAFQLAQWEIAFDDDVTLSNPLGRLYVDGGQFQAGITDTAETWLTNIRTGSATTQSSLYLLSGQGVQDLVTPVPEPGTVAALGLGAIALLRRHKRTA